MALARYLADKGALSRLGKPEVGERLGRLITDGAVATCGIVMLEILYSARSSDDYGEVKALLAGLERVPVDDDRVRPCPRSAERLARRGEHRGPRCLTCCSRRRPSERG